MMDGYGGYRLNPGEEDTITKGKWDTCALILHRCWMQRAGWIWEFEGQ